MGRPILMILMLAVAANAATLDNYAPHCMQCVENSNVGHFVPGRRYTYTYKTETRTMASVGGSSDNERGSGLLITARVHVDTLSSCEAALWMEHVEVAEVDPTNSRVVRPSPRSREMAAALERSSAHFTRIGRKMMKLCADDKEPTWVTNIKRAVISNLQQNSQATKDTHRTVERDLMGDCDTTYTRVDGNPNDVRATKNLGACTNRHAFTSGMQAVDLGVDMAAEGLQGTQTCRYRLGVDHAIREVRCEQEQKMRLAGGNYVAVRGNSQLVLTTTGHVAKSARKRTNFRRTDLLFAHESDSRSGTDEAAAMNDAETQLKAAALRSAAGDVRPDTPRAFVELVQRLRRLNLHQLRELHKRVQRRHNMRASRSYYHDAIPMIGNKHSVSMMTELVMNGHVKGSEATAWLSSLAFMRNVDREMLERVLPLIQSARPHPQALLGVTALVHQYCSRRGAAPFCHETEEVRRIATHLRAGLHHDCAAGTANVETRRRIIYTLKAIGNARFTSLAPVLEACASRQANPAELRVAAIQAHRRFGCGKHQQFLYNLLKDHMQDSELRIHAYLQLMNCPTHELLNTIQKLLEIEQVNQVGSFIWTHLSNLKETDTVWKQPIRTMMQDYKLKRSFNLDKMKYSRNIEKSMRLPSYALGASIESNIIFSQKSFVPRYGSLNLSTEILGKNVNLLELDTRVEGLENILEAYLAPNKNAEKGKPRKKRSVNFSEMEKLGKQIMGSVGVKIFGHQVSHTEYRHGYDKLTKPNFLDALLKLAAPQTLEWSKNVAFLESKVTVPMLSGLPLTLGLNGTASLRLSATGKLDVRNMFTWPTTFDVDGVFRPSGAVHLAGMASIGAADSQYGVRFESTLHTSTELSGHMRAKDSANVDVKFKTAKSKQEIVNFETGTFVVHNNHPYVMSEDSQKASFSHCLGEPLRNAFGLELCGKITYPSSVKYITNVPLKGSIVVNKVDSHSSISFSLAYNKARKTKNGISEQDFTIHYDTPNSKNSRNNLLKLSHKIGSWKDIISEVVLRTSGTDVSIKFNHKVNTKNSKKSGSTTLQILHNKVKMVDIQNTFVYAMNTTPKKIDATTKIMYKDMNMLSASTILTASNNDIAGHINVKDIFKHPVKLLVQLKSKTRGNEGFDYQISTSAKMMNYETDFRCLAVKNRGNLNLRATASYKMADGIVRNGTIILKGNLPSDNSRSFSAFSSIQFSHYKHLNYVFAINGHLPSTSVGIERNAAIGYTLEFNGHKSHIILSFKKPYYDNYININANLKIDHTTSELKRRQFKIVLGAEKNEEHYMKLNGKIDFSGIQYALKTEVSNPFRDEKLFGKAKLVLSRHSGLASKTYVYVLFDISENYRRKYDIDGELALNAFGVKLEKHKTTGRLEWANDRPVQNFKITYDLKSRDDVSIFSVSGNMKIDKQSKKLKTDGIVVVHGFAKEKHTLSVEMGENALDMDVNVACWSLKSQRKVLNFKNNLKLTNQLELKDIALSTLLHLPTIMDDEKKAAVQLSWSEPHDIAASIEYQWAPHKSINATLGLTYDNTKWTEKSYLLSAALSTPLSFLRDVKVDARVGGTLLTRFVKLFAQWAPNKRIESNTVFTLGGTQAISKIEWTLFTPLKKLSDIHFVLDRDATADSITWDVSLRHRTYKTRGKVSYHTEKNELNYYLVLSSPLIDEDKDVFKIEGHSRYQSSTGQTKCTATWRKQKIFNIFVSATEKDNSYIYVVKYSGFGTTYIEGELKLQDQRQIYVDLRTSFKRLKTFRANINKPNDASAYINIALNNINITGQSTLNKNWPVGGKLNVNTGLSVYVVEFRRVKTSGGWKYTGIAKTNALILCEIDAKLDNGVQFSIVTPEIRGDAKFQVVKNGFHVQKYIFKANAWQNNNNILKYSAVYDTATAHLKKSLFLHLDDYKITCQHEHAIASSNKFTISSSWNLNGAEFSYNLRYNFVSWTDSTLGVSITTPYKTIMRKGSFLLTNYFAQNRVNFQQVIEIEGVEKYSYSSKFIFQNLSRKTFILQSKLFNDKPIFNVEIQHVFNTFWDMKQILEIDISRKYNGRIMYQLKPNLHAFDTRITWNSFRMLYNHSVGIHIPAKRGFVDVLVNIPNSFPLIAGKAGLDLNDRSGRLSVQYGQEKLMHFKIATKRLLDITMKCAYPTIGSLDVSYKLIPFKGVYYYFSSQLNTSVVYKDKSVKITKYITNERSLFKGGYSAAVSIFKVQTSGAFHLVRKSKFMTLTTNARFNKHEFATRVHLWHLNRIFNFLIKTTVASSLLRFGGALAEIKLSESYCFTQFALNTTLLQHNMKTELRFNGIKSMLASVSIRSQLLNDPVLVSYDHLFSKAFVRFKINLMALDKYIRSSAVINLKSGISQAKLSVRAPRFVGSIDTDIMGELKNAYSGYFEVTSDLSKSVWSHLGTNNVYVRYSLIPRNISLSSRMSIAGYTKDIQMNIIDLQNSNIHVTANLSDVFAVMVRHNLNEKVLECKAEFVCIKCHTIKRIGYDVIVDKLDQPKKHFEVKVYLKPKLPSAITAIGSFHMKDMHNIFDAAIKTPFKSMQTTKIYIRTNTAFSDFEANVATPGILTFNASQIINRESFINSFDLTSSVLKKFNNIGYTIKLSNLDKSIRNLAFKLVVPQFLTTPITASGELSLQNHESSVLLNIETPFQQFAQGKLFSNCKRGHTTKSKLVIQSGVYSATSNIEISKNKKDLKGDLEVSGFFDAPIRISSYLKLKSKQSSAKISLSAPFEQLKHISVLAECNRGDTTTTNAVFKMNKAVLSTYIDISKDKRMWTGRAQSTGIPLLGDNSKISWVAKLKRNELQIDGNIISSLYGNMNGSAKIEHGEQKNVEVKVRTQLAFLEEFVVRGGLNKQGVFGNLKYQGVRYITADVAYEMRDVSAKLLGEIRTNPSSTPWLTLDYSVDKVSKGSINILGKSRVSLSAGNYVFNLKSKLRNEDLTVDIDFNTPDQSFGVGVSGTIKKMETTVRITRSSYLTSMLTDLEVRAENKGFKRLSLTKRGETLLKLELESEKGYTIFLNLNNIQFENVLSFSSKSLTFKAELGYKQRKYVEKFLASVKLNYMSDLDYDILLRIVDNKYPEHRLHGKIMMNTLERYEFTSKLACDYLGKFDVLAQYDPSAYWFVRVNTPYENLSTIGMKMALKRTRNSNNFDLTLMHGRDNYIISGMYSIDSTMNSLKLKIAAPSMQPLVIKLSQNGGLWAGRIEGVYRFGKLNTSFVTKWNFVKYVSMSTTVNTPVFRLAVGLKTNENMFNIYINNNTMNATFKRSERKLSLNIISTGFITKSLTMLVENDLSNFRMSMDVPNHMSLTVTSNKASSLDATITYLRNGKNDVIKFTSSVVYKSLNVRVTFNNDDKFMLNLGLIKPTQFISHVRLMSLVAKTEFTLLKWSKYIKHVKLVSQFPFIRPFTATFKSTPTNTYFTSKQEGRRVPFFDVGISTEKNAVMRKFAVQIKSVCPVLDGFAIHVTVLQNNLEVGVKLHRFGNWHSIIGQRRGGYKIMLSKEASFRLDTTTTIDVRRHRVEIVGKYTTKKDHHHVKFAADSNSKCDHGTISFNADSPFVRIPHTFIEYSVRERTVNFLKVKHQSISLEGSNRDDDTTIKLSDGTRNLIFYQNSNGQHHIESNYFPHIVKFNIKAHTKTGLWASGKLSLLNKYNGKFNLHHTHYTWNRFNFNHILHMGQHSYSMEGEHLIDHNKRTHVLFLKDSSRRNALHVYFKSWKQNTDTVRHHGISLYSYYFRGEHIHNPVRHWQSKIEFNTPMTGRISHRCSYKLNNSRNFYIKHKIVTPGHQKPIASIHVAVSPSNRGQKGILEFFHNKYVSPTRIQFSTLANHDGSSYTHKVQVHRDQKKFLHAEQNIRLQRDHNEIQGNVKLWHNDASWSLIKTKNNIAVTFKLNKIRAYLSGSYLAPNGGTQVRSEFRLTSGHSTLINKKLEIQLIKEMFNVSISLSSHYIPRMQMIFNIFYNDSHKTMNFRMNDDIDLGFVLQRFQRMKLWANTYELDASYDNNNGARLMNIELRNASRTVLSIRCLDQRGSSMARIRREEGRALVKVTVQWQKSYFLATLGEGYGAVTHGKGYRAMAQVVSSGEKWAIVVNENSEGGFIAKITLPRKIAQINVGIVEFGKNKFRLILNNFDKPLVDIIVLKYSDSLEIRGQQTGYEKYVTSHSMFFRVIRKPTEHSLKFSMNKYIFNFKSTKDGSSNTWRIMVDAPPALLTSEIFCSHSACSYTTKLKSSDDWQVTLLAHDNKSARDLKIQVVKRGQITRFFELKRSWSKSKLSEVVLRLAASQRAIRNPLVLKITKNEETYEVAINEPRAGTATVLVSIMSKAQVTRKIIIDIGITPVRRTKRSWRLEVSKNCHGNVCNTKTYIAFPSNKHVKLISSVAQNGETVDLKYSGNILGIPNIHLSGIIKSFCLTCSTNIDLKGQITVPNKAVIDISIMSQKFIFLLTTSLDGKQKSYKVTSQLLQNRFLLDWNSPTSFIKTETIWQMHPSITAKHRIIFSPTESFEFVLLASKLHPELSIIASSKIDTQVNKIFAKATFLDKRKIHAEITSVQDATATPHASIDMHLKNSRSLLIDMFWSPTAPTELRYNMAIFSTNVMQRIHSQFTREIVPLLDSKDKLVLYLQNGISNWSKLFSSLYEKNVLYTKDIVINILIPAKRDMILIGAKASKLAQLTSGRLYDIFTPAMQELCRVMTFVEDVLKSQGIWENRVFQFVAKHIKSLRFFKDGMRKILSISYTGAIKITKVATDNLITVLKWGRQYTNVESWNMLTKNVQTVLKMGSESVKVFLDKQIRFLSQIQTKYADAARMQADSFWLANKLIENSYNLCINVLREFVIPKDFKLASFIHKQINTFFGYFSEAAEDTFGAIGGVLTQSGFTRYDTSRGRITLEIYLPIQLDSLRTLPRANFRDWKQKWIRDFRGIQTWFINHSKYINEKLYDLEMAYNTVMSYFDINASQYMPTFATYGTVSNNHIHTFDKHHYDFKGSCGYILSKDLKNKNWQVNMNYKKVGKPYISFNVNNKHHEIMPNYEFRIDGKLVDLPYSHKNLTVLRIGDMIKARHAVHGFSVTCDPKNAIHTVGISGWYHGKVGGLLGNADNEAYNDVSTKASVASVFDFTQKWKHGKCSHYNAAIAVTSNDSKSRRMCALFFKSIVSPFARCFGAVNPKTYYDMCAEDTANLVPSKAKKMACVSITVYATECKRVGYNLETPKLCDDCIASDARQTAKSLSSVIFVVEQSKCNKHVKQVLAGVARTMKSDWFGLITYGNPDFGFEPVTHTNGNDLLFNTDKLEKMLGKLKFFDNRDNSDKIDPTKAIHLASWLRPSSSNGRTVVLVKCETCRDNHKYPESEIRRFMRHAKINLVVMQPTIESQVVGKIGMNNIFGISSAKHVSTNKGIKKVSHDLKMNDQCASASLSGNGAVFHTRSLKYSRSALTSKYATLVSDHIKYTRLNTRREKCNYNCVRNPYDGKMQTICSRS